MIQLIHNKEGFQALKKTLLKIRQKRNISAGSIMLSTGISLAGCSSAEPVVFFPVLKINLKTIKKSQIFLEG